MGDIFISYSRVDRLQCNAIADRLRHAGFSIWFDSNIEPGTSFDREIEREIRAAAAVLVLWSPTSVESDWVRNEARMGKRANKLIALRIDECEPPLEFGSVQTVDMFDRTVAEEQEAWAQITDRIARLAGTPASPPIERPPKPGAGAPPPSRRDARSWLPWTITLVATLVAIALAWQPWHDRPTNDANAAPDTVAPSVVPALASAPTPAQTEAVTEDTAPAKAEQPKCRMVPKRVMVDQPVQVTKYRTETVTSPTRTSERLNAGYRADSYSYLDSASRIDARNAECERQVWNTSWPGNGWGKKCEGGQMEDERAECKCTATSCSVSLYGTCVRQTQSQRSIPYIETEISRIPETHETEVCD